LGSVLLNLSSALGVVQIEVGNPLDQGNRPAVDGLEKGCKLLYTAIQVKDMYGFELIIMRRIFRCRVLGEELAGWWRYVHEERGGTALADI
jgi:hypothetical protein